MPKSLLFALHKVFFSIKISTSTVYCQKASLHVNCHGNVRLSKDLVRATQRPKYFSKYFSLHFQEAANTSFHRKFFFPGKTLLLMVDKADYTKRNDFFPFALTRFRPLTITTKQTDLICWRLNSASFPSFRKGFLVLAVVISKFHSSSLNDARKQHEISSPSSQIK